MKKINALPIDNKSIMTHFTERFHKGDCLAQYDGVHRREVFELFGCRCDISYEYGKNWFRLWVLEGEKQAQMKCYNYFEDVIGFFNSHDKDKQIIYNPGTGLYGWYSVEEIPAVPEKSDAKGKKVYVLRCLEIYDFTPMLTTIVYSDLGEAILKKDEIVSDWKGELEDRNGDRYEIEETADAFYAYYLDSYLDDYIKIDIEQEEVE